MKNWRDKYEILQKEKEEFEVVGDDHPKHFLRRWVWKREYKTETLKFEKPYIYNFQISKYYPNIDKKEIEIKIRQQKFNTEGFASTVWDSSIVISKYFEKWWQQKIKNRRCMDMSAGCGLVGCLLYHLGASSVTSTDLTANIPLLKKNIKLNTTSLLKKEKILINSEPIIKPLRWGDDVLDLNPPFDIIVSCDIMYIRDQVFNLHKSLLELTKSGSIIYLCYGRNCFVVDEFLDYVEKKGHFEIDFIKYCDYEEFYKSPEIDCIVLTRRKTPITTHD